MRRTPEQILRSMDEIARDITVSGLLGQARRLRRFRTEMTHFVNSENKTREKTRDPFVAVTASLAAAISLLERTPGAARAAPSNMMFDHMLADYRRSLEAARKALQAQSMPRPIVGKLCARALARRPHAGA